MKVSVIKLDASSVFFNNGHIARSSMLRLSVIQKMSTPYMHLDVDTLPRSGWESIENFMPNAESIIAAVKQPDILQIGNKSSNKAIQLMDEFYFQTGIFLINPTRWILDGFQAKTDAAVKNYDSYGFEFSDQCILNFVVGKKYSSLPPDFNAFPINARTKFSKIVHFAGPHKPWNVKILKFLSSRFRAVLSARSTVKLLLKGQMFKAFSQLYKRFHEFSNEIFWIVIYKLNFKFFLRLFRNIQ
jgi:lipopolysaccharide biosynthesis glycosyltransferase